MSFKHNRNLGQNFLKDTNIVKKIVDNSLIDDGCLVIEIGPGEGVLSEFIIPKSKYTVLYEIDKRLEDFLNHKLGNNSNYKLIINDFLKENIVDEVAKYDYDKLFVVANLPYYITTPILEKFINDEIFPDEFVLMMQKEVADRFSAKVNSRDYGSLTVLINYYYDVEKLFDVSRNSFYPVPKVDSSVIRMRKKKDRIKVKDFGFFKKFVRDSFKFKRKNLRNNLKEYNLDIILRVLKKYNLDLSVRAEAISLDIFVELANELV